MAIPPARRGLWPGTSDDPPASLWLTLAVPGGASSAARGAVNRRRRRRGLCCRHAPRPSNVLAPRPTTSRPPGRPRVASLQRPGICIARAEVLSVDVGAPTTRVRVAVDHDGPGFPRRWFARSSAVVEGARDHGAAAVCYRPRAHFSARSRAMCRCAPSVLAGQVPSRVGVDPCARGRHRDRRDGRGARATPGRPDRRAWPWTSWAHLHARFWERLALRTEHRWLAGPVAH